MAGKRLIQKCRRRTFVGQEVHRIFGGENIGSVEEASTELMVDRELARLESWRP